jgi:ribosomal protein L22
MNDYQPIPDGSRRLRRQILHLVRNRRVQEASALVRSELKATKRYRHGPHLSEVMPDYRRRLRAARTVLGMLQKVEVARALGTTPIDSEGGGPPLKNPQP